MHQHTQNHHHPHDHGHEGHAAGPRSQHVVLELGDGIGALIVHTDADLLGTEVEISRAGDDADRNHKEVLQRITDGRSAYVLVFDNLAEGDHTLWIDDVAKTRDVRITSGAVAELDWRRRPQPTDGP